MDQSEFDPPAEVQSGLQDVLPSASCGRWSMLHGGRTNRSWRVETKDAILVVKLFARCATNPLFPNDPKLEALALGALKSQGFAPDLLATFQTALGPCIIYQHVPGTLWSSGTYEIGGLMRRLHQCQPPQGLPTNETTPQVLTKNALALSEKAAEFLPLLPLIPALPPVKATFLHGDIVAGNLICSPTGMALIDWQCPALGDPCHDIAVFLSPAMMQLYRGAPLSKEEIDDFFSGYGSPTICNRYHSLARWFHFRMAAYCFWKAELGDNDYREAAQLEVAALNHCCDISPGGLESST